MFVRVLRQHAKLLASRIRPFTTTASTLSSSVSLNPDISYVHGVPDTSTGYSSLTLGQVLERQAELNPNKVAFIVDHQQITKTYSKFNSDVDQLAKALLSIGCRRGDKVAIWAVNSYEWLLTQYATAKIGCVFVNLNPGYKEKELLNSVNLVGVETLITNQHFRASNYYERLQNITAGLLDNANGYRVHSKEMPTLKNVIVIDDAEEIVPSKVTRFSDLMNMGQTDQSLKELLGDNVTYFDDVINIQFTSGTTGSPKGSMLTHHNIVQNVKFSSEQMFKDYLPPNGKEPVICVPNPLYHCFGSITGSATSVYVNGTMVLPAPIFNAKSTLSAIEKYRCNFVFGTPTMWTDVSNAGVDQYNTESLTRGIMSGAPCPPPLVKRMLKTFPSLETIMIPYGATELSPIATITSPTEVGKRKFESVGLPLPYVEVKVVDPVTKQVCPIETTGEVCVRGHGTFPGYYNQPDKTMEVMDSNFWYYTGDIGKLDNEGYLYISGRIKDMIIRGGENIYPREIEDYLSMFEDIEDAHIVGIPDERLGEDLVAFVKVKDGKQVTADEIRKFLKEKISHFKVPKLIEFVDDFPRTVTGKVRKIDLKQIATEKFAPKAADLN